MATGPDPIRAQGAAVLLLVFALLVLALQGWILPAPYQQFLSDDLFQSQLAGAVQRWNDSDRFWAPGGEESNPRIEVSTEGIALIAEVMGGPIQYRTFNAEIRSRLFIWAALALVLIATVILLRARLRHGHEAPTDRGIDG